ncbi:uncharacterized protein PGTG_04935 [Puccinia graminis f. sp. tritici CRL 75-36-700-3]|uniref:Uncharacterized protein n=1 Tax=Puccinia graminis f. sp. tritici (strain CRL 75-36-700-3 / race SCCL) TaxID=418459 RepID=E3K3C2_PUCGT|nr:uncharacterized protein PGTG_04935 [Puccinia graminis f. sp. tritici CRL 75-36-700-3]EFP78979.1 hypothetical protein PGTG_04935 [Puccinia graminis f. sp. tritici CRL 75-36-700-3]
MPTTAVVGPSERPPLWMARVGARPMGNPGTGRCGRVDSPDVGCSPATQTQAAVRRPKSSPRVPGRLSDAADSPSLRPPDGGEFRRASRLRTNSAHVHRAQPKLPAGAPWCRGHRSQGWPVRATQGPRGEPRARGVHSIAGSPGRHGVRPSGAQLDPLCTFKVS